VLSPPSYFAQTLLRLRVLWLRCLLGGEGEGQEGGPNKRNDQNEVELVAKRNEAEVDELSGNPKGPLRKEEKNGAQLSWCEWYDMKNYIYTDIWTEREGLEGRVRSGS